MKANSDDITLYHMSTAIVCLRITVSTGIVVLAIAS